VRWELITENHSLIYDYLINSFVPELRPNTVRHASYR